MSPSGKFWAYGGLLIRVALYLWASDRLKDTGGQTIGRLLAMGTAAGLGEILVDWVLIHGVANGRLEYLTGNDVVFLGSPIWMPAAWACVIVELGYPAVRLYGLVSSRASRTAAIAVASLVCAASAGITVGLYEYFAFRSGWWKYHAAAAMIGRTCALYIPIGEALMFLPILPIAAHAIGDEDHPLAAAIESGSAFAALIGLGYAVAYLLLEAGRRAA
ncbi:MAG: hypothetical protein JO102_04040 [Elusimicrobia bacterium]|nr:hypothetical protein [Elusimicrobiota bacterium]